MKPQLIIKDLRRNRSPAGTMNGTIYWKLGHISFPERGWDDLADVLMAWWRTELFVKARRRRNFTLDFVGGPYSIRGIHLHRNDFLLKLKYSRRVVGMTHVNLGELITAFRRAEMSFKVRSNVLKHYARHRA